MEENFILRELKEYSIRDLISTRVFKGTTLIAVLVGLISYFSGATEYSKTLSVLLPISIQASIVLAAITTAGFVMLVAASKDDKFVMFLKDKNLFDGMLFLFIEPVLWGVVNVIVSTLFLIWIYLSPYLECGIGALLLSVSVWLFFYAVLSYLCLYNAYHMYGCERLDYLRSQEKSSKTSSEKQKK